MKIRSIFLLLLASSSSANLFADTWTQKASISGVRDGAVGFSIGNKGYIGTGFNSGAMTYYHDFWEFNPDSNTWTQKADFGGGNLAFASGFAINNKGYIGIGLTNSGPTTDFWEWDQSTNTWIQKASFPDSARYGAVGFSIGTKGYFGTGGINPPLTLYNDFWEWDGDTTSATYNTWIQKVDFGGAPRAAACGFSIGTKGYIGTGSTNGSNTGDTKDFWEWDGDTSSITYNTWTQKSDVGGIERDSPCSFSIGGNGYVGTGGSILGTNLKDFWQYNPSTNLWTQKANFGGFQRGAATGFSIGNRGYIGMGFFFSVSTDDFWEYCDTCTGTGTTEIQAWQNVSVYPNPAHELFTVSGLEFSVEEMKMYNSLGEKVFSTAVNSKQQTVNCKQFPSGIYFLKLSNKTDSFTQKIIIE